MQKATNYARSVGLKVSDNGTILSGLPDDFEDSMTMTSMIEDNTITADGQHTYTIIKNKLVKIEI